VLHHPLEDKEIELEVLHHPLEDKEIELEVLHHQLEDKEIKYMEEVEQKNIKNQKNIEKQKNIYIIKCNLKIIFVKYILLYPEINSIYHY